MSIVERLPVTRQGQGVALACAASTWALAYWVNGHLWDAVLFDAAWLRPTA